MLDEPEAGRYSAGFLSGMIDSKMAALRTTTNSLFLGISSQRFKVVGDICLLIVAVVWLGTGIWTEIKGEESKNDGDAIAAAEKQEAEEKQETEDTANAQIFAKTIKPLLKERCYDCHGPDKQSSKLSLAILEDDETADIKGLFSTIEKGNAGASELLARVKSTGDDRMPPEGKGEMFSAEQADELEKWIDAGAPIPKPAVDTEKIVNFATMLFKGVLPIVFILILHYLTGVLFNSGDSLIKNTPSQLSSTGIMKAMALVILLAGFAAGFAGLTYGVIDITKGFSDNWLNVLTKIGGGILLYMFCASLARLWLKPAQLNIKVAPGNTAGDEALGVMAMFSKTLLKAAPILYGAALIFCLLFSAMNLIAKDDIAAVAPPAEAAATAAGVEEEGFFASMATLAKDTVGDVINYFKDSPLPIAAKYLDKNSVLMMAIKIPIYLFFYFLFSYVLVEAARALFNVSSRRA